MRETKKSLQPQLNQVHDRFTQLVCDLYDLDPGDWSNDLEMVDVPEHVRIAEANLAYAMDPISSLRDVKAAIDIVKCVIPWLELKLTLRASP